MDLCLSASEPKWIEADNGYSAHTARAGCLPRQIDLTQSSRRSLAQHCALALRVSAATAGVWVGFSSPKMLAVASLAEGGAMSDDEDEASTPPPSFVRMRYTFVLLNEYAEWCDLCTLYAFDDAEALAVSKTLANGRPIKVWLGFHCIGVFLGTEH